MDQKTLEDLVKKYPCAVLSQDAEGVTAITCPVRLQFVWLEKPRENKDNPNAKPMYQLSGIVPAFADITALKQIARKAWEIRDCKGRDTPKHIPLKEQSKLHGEYDGFGPEGVYFDAKTINVVECFDANMKKIPVDMIKAGYWARIKIRAKAYDKNGNWGVLFGLQGLQLIAEDKVFSSQGNASDGFEAINAPAGTAPAAMPNGSANGASSLW